MTTIEKSFFVFTVLYPIMIAVFLFLNISVITFIVLMLLYIIINVIFYRYI